MADDSKKTTAITGLDSKPVERPNPWYHGGGVKAYAGTVEAVDGASIGSVYRFFRVGSWMRVDELVLMNDALSAGATDIGLYRTAADGGAVVDADFFASAVPLASAQTPKSGLNVTYESDSTAMNIAKCDKRIWEALGLTVDPGLEYDVAATLTTAAGAAGTISLRGKTVS
jgi:hypothetical protein